MSKITARWWGWWYEVDTTVRQAGRRWRILTRRADTMDVVMWAAGEFRRLGERYLRTLLVDEMAGRRRAAQEAADFVRSLTDDEVRVALRQLELADVDPDDVVAAAESFLRDAA